MSLPSIAAAELPPLAYAHDASHDLTLTATRSAFRPIKGSGWAKPGEGGLWTAPVISCAADGGPIDTAWLKCIRDDQMGLDGGTHLTEIIPDGDARILLIDGHSDLTAIVNTFPSAMPELPTFDGRYPDWEAITTAGWDAVYLTDWGQIDTRMPPYGSPELYGWDCATVLWLHPAYTTGRTLPAKTS